MTTTRLSLFRCRRCGRTLAASPDEVRGCVRARWPRCCNADMALLIAAPRPATGVTEVSAPPFPLPLDDPNAGTTVLPTLPAPPPRPNPVQ
ncbi:hypothetical protein [Frigoriglobus tundricola]|uniref:Uncharacterized protein n=1 Tax=Frigoriglobus tundricola TaxID=2774151 RepID=A0A6M5YKJ2_9BACT|nr:hypothetical protein [Frigoriglobus tundricola]QJW94599.1 hypothetical protein FTUN_2120 [Frigoriglobus tundricola]